MSYDVDLVCRCCDHPLLVEHHEGGGTYIVGGTTHASLNITYNYSPYYQRLGEGGLRWLHDKTGAECEAMLSLAVESIRFDKETEGRLLAGRPIIRDYWLPSREQAVAPLQILLVWAKLHPKGVFKVA